MKTEKIDVLLGLQWGDEGKGKVVDVLTPRYDVVARFQGGPNAGHTLIFDDKKFVLKSIPSGVFQGNKQNIIFSKPRPNHLRLPALTSRTVCSYPRRHI